MLPLERGAKFQGLEVLNFVRFGDQKHEKTHVVEDLDCDSIFGGFGEGFGRPKTSIFAVFWKKNRRQKNMASWKAPGSLQDWKKAVPRSLEGD